MEELVSELLTVRQAIAVIDALPVAPRKMRVALRDADGLRLAQDLVADRDYPAFDKALMDGYAVRSADVVNVPVELSVVGESAAGNMLRGAVGLMEAMAVMTGAPIPGGADAVVPIEQTAGGEFVSVGKRVRVLQGAAPGRNIAARGSDTREETVLVSAGAVMNPPRMAVAASVGAAKVEVWDRPRCAVLATGDELVGVDESPAAIQLRNSNNPMLCALLARLGCAVDDMGVAADRPETIAAAIRRGLVNDVLFVTGGMSMGRYDYVPRILCELGGKLAITKLRIKPGKPFVLAAMPGGKYVVGLPGNPVSAFVCTVRLASRLLARIGGGVGDDRVLAMPLASGVEANGPREFYQPAVIEGGCVRPLEWKGSADIFTLAKAAALLIRPENEPARAAGEMIGVIRLD